MKTIILILFCCGSLLVAQESQEPVFDPNQLKDPEPKWPKIVNTIFNDSLNLEQWIQPDTVREITEGFRVQVLATRSVEKADSLRLVLEQQYEIPVYVTFEAPNYKLRLGDFIDRPSAEQLRKRLGRSGYPSAWIIRTRITPQRITPLEGTSPSSEPEE
ncbi:MAG: SPOR domain-containing protein [Fidelibacterota bacterium]